MPNETETPESIAAILAEMRDLAKPLRVGGDLCSNVALPATISIWADRIEAAYKREHAEWHAETDAAKDDRNRVACRMRSEFAARCRNCTERAPGNAAAMREAMGEIVLLTVKAGKSLRGDVACGIIASKARHALAAPARNCDTVRDEREALGWCRESVAVERDAAYDRGMRDAIRWLLAPAKKGSEK